MAQFPETIKVTVAVAGTRQRVVTDPKSTSRYVPWAYFEAAETNTAMVYVGDSLVSPSPLHYAVRLNGAGQDRGFNWTAHRHQPSVSKLEQSNQNLLDLYNVWVDAAANGQVLFVTIEAP